MALKQNIIYVYFKGKHQVTSKSQYQYNHGQFLYFADLNLPRVFEVHFSNDNKGYSKPKTGSNKLVEIPDEYFWSGASQIYAWVYLHSDTDDGETIYEVKIPLTKRAKPTDEEPLPQQESAMERAIAELNNAVEITTENANKTEEDKTQVGNIRDEVVDLKENIDATAETVAQKSQDAIEASRRSEASAQNAAEFEEGARQYSVNAEQSAQEALESKTIAKQKADVATQASAEALGYRDEAVNARDIAVQAKQNIVDYRDETKGYRDETLNTKNDIQTLKGQIDETAEEIEDISDSVKEDAQNASQSASSANQSSINASESASQAGQFADGAEQSANQAEQSMNTTEDYKNQSETYKTQAETFKNQAEQFKNQSETNVSHYPKIVNDYWYVWDATNGEYINTNVDANGIKGDTGNGIASVALNDDYTLTITFTDDTTYTTSSIRGQQGEKGDTGRTGESGVYIGTEEPENEDIKVWIDIDDDGTSEDLVKEIDELKRNIYKPYVVDSASGSIASFIDGADDIPLKSLVVDINPVQKLNGYDSPWVAGGGKNLLNPDNVFGASAYYTINSDGSITVLKNNGTAWDNDTNFPISLEAGTYTVSRSMANGALTIRKASDNYGENICRLAPSATSGSFTLDGDDVIRIKFNSSSDATYPNTSFFQLEKGSTATDWTPYENICPISGWTGANVTATNTNLRGGIDLANDFKARITSAVINTTEKTVSWVYNATHNEVYAPKVHFKKNTRYTFIVTVQNASKRLNFRIYYTDGSVQALPDLTTTEKETLAIVTTANKTVSTIVRQAQGGTTKLYYDESGIFEGVLTASDFQQFGQTIPINWQTEAGTVYDGSLNVLSGVLRVTHQVKTFDGSENWSQIENTGKFYINKSLTEFDVYDSGWISNKYPYSGFKTGSLSMSIDDSFYTNYNNGSTLKERIFVFDSSFADADAFKSSLVANPLTVYGKLKEPIEIQLTPHEVKSLLGQNNIWADTGNTTAEYRADTKLYIDKKITEAFASLT